MGTKVDKVAEELLDQQAQTFIEENKELLEDPETSSDVLGRIFEHGTKVIQALGQAYQDAVAKEVLLATHYNEAQIDDSLSPKELQKRELPYKRAKKKSQERFAAFERFKVFMDKVKERREAKREEERIGPGCQDFDEDGNRITELPNSQQMRRIGEEEGRKMTEGMLDELSKRPAAPSPVRSAKETPDQWRVSYFKTIKEPTRPAPWWKRIFGIKEVPNNWIGSIPSAEPSEAPRSAREWPTTPSQAASDCEDYEKLLTWYEQNLEVLEKAVAGRQAGEPGDWQVVVDELLGRMGWCDRHMDTIEGRNADMAGSELVERREGLAARRSELGE